MSSVKGIVIADLHLRTKSPNQYQSMRQRVIQNNLNDLEVIITDSDYTHLVLLGDIYDGPYIGLGYERILMEFLRGVVDSLDKIIIVPGNHDSIGASSPYVLLGISPKVMVVDTKTIFKIFSKIKGGGEDGIQIGLLPWSDFGEVWDWPGEVKLVFAHRDVYSPFSKELKTKFSKRLVARPDIAFVFGHYHFPVDGLGDDKHMVSVGAFLSNGFDERLATSGYLEYKIDECGKVDLKRHYNKSVIIYIDIYEDKDIRIVKLDKSGHHMISCPLNIRSYLRSGGRERYIFRLWPYVKPEGKVKAFGDKLYYAIRFHGTSDEMRHDIVSELEREASGRVWCCEGIGTLQYEQQMKMRDDFETHYGENAVVVFNGWLEKQNYDENVITECRKVLKKVANERRKG